MAYHNNISALLLFFFFLTLITLPAQSQILSERNFEKIKKIEEKEYLGTPVKGNHKRSKRMLHYWESRLDEDGNIFNNVQANIQAVQQMYIDTFPAVIQGDWTQMGPLNTVSTDFSNEGVGRVNCVAFGSGTTWYAGTAGGGLWRTDIAGLYIGDGNYPWYPLTDSLPVLSISGIAVHPNNVDDVYILTGDGESMTYASRGTQPGIGILHSTNGGTSWDVTSLVYNVTQTQAGYKLGMYPGSPDTMLAACTDALYRTTDGWTTQSTAISMRCYDFEFKPNDPTTVYAACLGSLRRSTNGGLTFSNITSNLDQTNISPNTNMRRMAIAVTADDPNFLYVIISQANGGLMSFQVSNDGGDTFTETINNSFNILANSDPSTTTNGQGNYDLALWADPNNATTVMVGGVNIWKSTSAGVLWAEVMHWTNDAPEYTHADIHAIETNPFNGSIVVGSDGGLYSSSDGGLEWSKRSHGLGITQYYHLGVYTGFLGIPFVTGGAQDNGTSAGVGFTDPVFEMIGGGDGFRTYRGSDDGEAVRYRSVQNGRLYRQEYFLDSWLETHITPDGQLNGDGTGKGLWDTPYQTNPNNITEIVAGYDELYFTNDAGEDWVSMDYPNSVNYDGSEFISQLEWSKSQTNSLYFYVSDNTNRDLIKCEGLYVGVLVGDLEPALCTVEQLDNDGSMPTNNPSDIALNPYDDREVWLTFPGYNDSMKVFYNFDMVADSPWINISYNLPNVPVHCAAWDVDGLFVGTDIGAFYLPHGEEEWIYFSQGLPTVAVTELQVKSTILGKIIFASTWGRGIWWSTPPTPIRRTRWYVDDSAIGINNGANWTNAFPNFQTALDTILPGDSIWVAEGTYFPEDNAGFHLAFDNVKIWGGFDATEDQVSQRDFDLNPTILSGDIGILEDSLDNANHVFLFGGHNGNVLLDGFHVTKGYAHETQESSKGAGIYYSTDNLNGKPLIQNCKIYNNSALGGGGFPQHFGYGAGMFIGDYDRSDPDMFVINCTFENNRTLDSGGGLYIDSYNSNFPFDTGTAIVHLLGCSFINNITFARGGALCLEAGNASILKLYMDSTILSGNSLTWFKGNGAAMYCDGNFNSGGTLEVEISNSSFINNIGNSNTEGGAIYIDGLGATSDFSFSNTTFDNNFANVGGAILNYTPFNSTTSHMSFEDCTFSNNSANSGGAIHFTNTSAGNSTSDFNRCTFDNNLANGRAGAIYFNADSGGKFVSSIDSCTFTGNNANENGAIRMFIRSLGNQMNNPGTADIDISNSVFQGNHDGGNSSGGAIGFYSDQGIIDANIIDTDFADNSAGVSGGAVANVHSVPSDTSRVTVSYIDCNFNNNTGGLSTNGAGGAMYLLRSDAFISGCTFTENEARYGGAIYNYTTFADDTYTQTFLNCQFARNKGIDNGGAFYNVHHDPSEMVVNILDCLLDSNYTTSIFSGKGRGGAVYTFGEGRSKEYYSNTIFQNNVASKQAGAIYATNSFTFPDTMFLTVDSCTFTNNDAGVTGETIEIFASGGNAKIFSNWSNSNFFNDESGLMFLNGTNTGISKVIFSDCGFFKTIPNPEPGISPLLFKQVFMNERSP